MLTIRDEQLRTFGRAAQTSFESTLVAHARAFAPRLAALRGDAAVQALVRRAMVDARAHGFDLRGPARFWVEMALAYGVRWYDDPRLESVNGPLRRVDLGQCFRADLVYEALMAHVAQVEGRDKERARAALTALVTIDWRTELSMPAPPEVQLQAVVARLPEACRDALGAPVRLRLVRSASEACGQLAIDCPGCAVLVSGLMLGFGHGVLDDPMYPWVLGTLRSGRAGAVKRCEALARKTRWYLRATLDHWSS